MSGNLNIAAIDGGVEIRQASSSMENANVFVYSKNDEKNSNQKLNSNERYFVSRFKEDFEYVKCIGRGGYGTVFHNKNKLDKSDYAIKRIQLSKSKGQEHENSILREVKALAKSDHPNIVRYYQAWIEKPPHGWQEQQDKNLSIDQDECEGDDDDDECNEHFNNEDATISNDSFDIEFNSNISGTKHEFYSQAMSAAHLKPNKRAKNALNAISAIKAPMQKTYFYIQMQFCKQNLCDWLFKNNIEARNPYISAMVQQIVDGVKYIHEMRLIHRDLKPSNIFLTEDNKVKIGDFGLVRNISESFECAYGAKICKSQTHEVGTLFYMAPEMFKKGHYDRKVDIYSLGVIFYELLNYFGTHMERYKALQDLGNGNVSNEFANNYREELKLLRQMLSKQSNERPSASELIEHIKILSFTKPMEQWSAKILQINAAWQRD